MKRKTRRRFETPDAGICADNYCGKEKFQLRFCAFFGGRHISLWLGRDLVRRGAKRKKNK